MVSSSVVLGSVGNPIDDALLFGASHVGINAVMRRIGSASRFSEVVVRVGAEKHRG